MTLPHPKPGHLVHVAVSLIDQLSSLLSPSNVGAGQALDTDEQLSRESELIPGGSVGKHVRHVLDHFRALLEVRIISESLRCRDRADEAIDPRTSNRSGRRSALSITFLLLFTEGELVHSYHRLRHPRAPHADRVLPLRRPIRPLLDQLSPLSASPAGGLRRRLVLAKREGRDDGEDSGGAELRDDVGQRGQPFVGLSLRCERRCEAHSSCLQMWFVSHHAIHHMSAIRVIVCAGRSSFTSFSYNLSPHSALLPTELHLSLPIDFGVAPSTLLSRQQVEAPAIPNSKI